MSDKKRINQIAKETGLTNAELVSAAQTLGFEVKSHSSSVTAEQAEKIIQSAKTGTDQTAKVAEKPVKKSQPKAAESAKKNKEDHPRTFAGKAVVEDPAILARIKAKEEAEKAAKVEVASTEHPVVTEKPKASEPVKKAEPKVEAKSEPKVEKVETKDNTATSKAEVKPENVADKKEPVVTEEKKKSLTQKPRIQIKVIKRAEDIKKEQAAARPEKKNSTKIVMTEIIVVIIAVLTKMGMVKVETIMIRTVHLVKDKIKVKNVTNSLHQVVHQQQIRLHQLLLVKQAVVTVTVKNLITTVIIQKMVTVKVVHFA